MYKCAPKIKSIISLDQQMESPKEHLPFTVPKSVPRWVMGFPSFLKNELQVDDPDVATIHDGWLRFETMYWKLYHERGKPRKPRKKAPEPEPDMPDPFKGDTGEGQDDAACGEPPAKQAKTRLDTRVKNKWKQRFERLRKIAREHAIAALESEVNDMEKDLDEE